MIGRGEVIVRTNDWIGGWMMIFGDESSLSMDYCLIDWKMSKLLCKMIGRFELKVARA